MQITNHKDNLTKLTAIEMIYRNIFTKGYQLIGNNLQKADIS